MRGVTRDDGWPCGCIKRDNEGELIAVKFHPLNVKRCRTCGAERPTYGKYYCSACGRLLERNSKKRWLRSDCGYAGRTVRIYLI
jgi:hypothetical protein